VEVEEEERLERWDGRRVERQDYDVTPRQLPRSKIAGDVTRIFD